MFDELHLLPYQTAKSICIQAFNETYLRLVLEHTKGNNTRAAKIANMNKGCFRRLRRLTEERT